MAYDPLSRPTDLNIPERQRDVARLSGPRKSVITCLIGPPCAGKGTLARALLEAEGEGILHVNTGQLLRERAAHDPDLRARLDAGQMATNEEVFAVLGECAEQAEAQGTWLLLDGTPRRPEQLTALLSTPQAMGGRFALIILDAPEDVLRTRTLARAAEGRPEDTEEGLKTRLKLWAPQVRAIRREAQALDIPLLELDGQERVSNLAQKVQALTLSLWISQDSAPPNPDFLPRSLGALLLERTSALREPYAFDRLTATMDEAPDAPLPPESRRLRAALLGGVLSLHEGDRELLSVKTNRLDDRLGSQQLRHAELRQIGLEESTLLWTLRHHTRRQAEENREMQVATYKSDLLPEARWRVSVLSDGRFKVVPPQGRSEFYPSLQAAQLRAYGMIEEATSRQPLEGRLAMRLEHRHTFPRLATVTEVRRGPHVLGVTDAQLDGAGADWGALTQQSARELNQNRQGLMPWRPHLTARHAELRGLAETLTGEIITALSVVSPDEDAEALLREQVREWQGRATLPVKNRPDITVRREGLPTRALRGDELGTLTLRPLPGAQMTLYLDRQAELWVVTGQATLAVDITGPESHGSVWITPDGQALIYPGNSPRVPEGATIFTRVALITPGAAGETRQISLQPYTGACRALSDEAQAAQISVHLGSWAGQFDVRAPLEKERSAHQWLRPEF